MRNEMKSWLKFGAAFLAVALLVWLAPAVRQVLLIREYHGLSRDVQRSISDMKTQRPADVPKEQWDRATEWTSNIIAQVFFGLDEAELPGLRKLANDITERRKGPVDLVTLQWIWDEVERCDARPDSCAVRFRDARLLAKEPITDESLPQVWSLDRVMWLDLHGTEITDASVPALQRLSQLKVLHLDDTAVSDGGVETLKKSLPDCDITSTKRVAQR